MGDQGREFDNIKVRSDWTSSASFVDSLGGLFSAHALGFQTELDDGTKIISTTNISYGSQWRADNPVRALVGPAYGGVSGSSANDDGNLNYRKGDQVSTVRDFDAAWECALNSQIKKNRGDSGPRSTCFSSERPAYP